MDKFPDAMLFARALTAGARAVCPDIVGQYYTPEEMGAPVDAEGNYIDSTATVVDKPAKRVIEIVDEGDHDGGLMNEPVMVVVEEPKPAPTPASIRASIVKSGQTWNIKAWRKVHDGVIDMATNYGVTSVDLAAHTVPNEVFSQSELKTHTEALLDLCEAMATALPA
jgi:hypothetical protein